MHRGKNETQRKWRVKEKNMTDGKKKQMKRGTETNENEEQRIFNEGTLKSGKQTNEWRVEIKENYCREWNKSHTKTKRAKGECNMTERNMSEWKK